MGGIELIDSEMKCFRSRVFACSAGLLGVVVGLGAQFTWMQHAHRGKQKTSIASPASNNKQLLPLGQTASSKLCGDCQDWTAEQCKDYVRNTDIAHGPRDTMLLPVLVRWISLVGFGQVHDEVDSFKDPHVGSKTLFDAWTIVDENAAMNSGKYASEYDELRMIFAMEMGYANFIEYVLKAQNSIEYDNMELSRAVVQLGRNNPLLGASVADERIPMNKQSLLIAALVEGWASHDPKAAYDWLTAQGLDVRVSYIIYDQLFDTWQMEDPEAMEKARKEMEKWFGQDPNSAQISSLRIVNNEVMDSMKRGLLANPFLSVQELHAALMKVKDWEHPFGSISPAVDHYGWYPPDTIAAIKEAEQLPAGKQKDCILKLLLETLNLTDPAEAEKIAQESGMKLPYHVTPPEQKAALLEEAMENPDAAFAKLFDEKNGADFHGMNATQLQEIAQKWIDQAPEQVAEWVINHPIADGSNRYSSLYIGNILGYGWARQDPLGAAAWAEELTDPSQQRRAWLAIEHYVATYNPEAAFLTALDILPADDPQRRGALRNALEMAAQSIGQPHAQALLASPALTAGERAYLAEQFKNLQDKP